MSDNRGGERIVVVPLGAGRYQIERDDRRSLAYAVHHEGRTWVFADGAAHSVATAPAAPRDAARQADADTMASPMPATVTSVAVQAGQHVSRGDTLLTLEAMKMELPIKAPRDGVVARVLCRRGDMVVPQVPLVELE